MLAVNILIISGFLCYHTGVANVISTLLPNTQICGLQGTSIDDGKESVAGLLESPWSALLEYERIGGKQEFLCGGSLINDKYVVTAAHCIKPLPETLKLVSVRLGEHTIYNISDCTEDNIKCSDTPLNVGIEKVITHDGYNRSNTGHINDIALIKLNTTVQFSDYIKPLCLPITSKILSHKYKHSLMTIVGWGKASCHSKINIKRRIKSNGITKEHCNEVFSSIPIIIEDTQLCAISSNDFCTDNGGTALTIHEDGNWYMTGIVSFGVTLCSYPTVYTRINSYVQWIVDNLEE